MICTAYLNIRKVIKLRGKSFNDNHKVKSEWNPQNVDRPENNLSGNAATSGMEKLLCL